MTTGDEPMLPQPSGDNAPMISGRGTRIIVEARYAYLAGNLMELLHYLSPEQAQHFSHEMARRAIILARKALSSIDPPEYAETIMELAEECLTLGTEEAAERMLDAMREANCDPRVFYDFYPRESGTLNAMFQMLGQIVAGHIYMSQAPDKVQGAVCYDQAKFMESLTPYPKTLNGEVYDPPDEAVKRWQLETAWAILHGRPLPPFPEYTL